MNLRKLLALLTLVAGLSAKEASAQIFWSNHSPSGVTDNIWCVTFANGTFAAVTNQGNLLTSPNGLNWSSQAIDQGVELISITYGNGKWVAVGDNGTILISSDLTTWIHATSATSNTLNGVLYNGSIWVAVGESGTVVTSLDAQNWILQPALSGVTGFLHGMAIVGFQAQPRAGFENGFLVCGEGGVLLTGSPDGTFVAHLPNIAGPNTSTANLEAVVERNGLTVAAGSGGTLLYGSGEIGGDAVFPLKFTQSSSPTPNVIFRGLTYGNGFFIAAGEQGSIFRSTDGINWLQSYAGDSPSTLSTATLLSAAYSPMLQRFVVTGTGGTILVSNPPPTVFGNISTRGYVSSSQTFIGGFVIEGTAPRTVVIRADGPVLSTFSVPSPLADPVLTVYDGSGTVVATNTGWTTNANPPGISTAALEAGAFTLPNPGKDSALLLTLPPGAYTAQITSASGGSGTTLFEAYTN